MRYHWIMTVQWPIGAGHGCTTSRGVTPELSKGSTRQEVFEEILQDVGARVGSTNMNVLFFTLEPNDL